ncbi:MAG: penicillin-binding protein, partial [Prevotellaceae bacterium]|nr:penicillin-binding protein [Prevotellaceae bacterium]
SIHFRTGELGQGSRTALPIFGYFAQSLLKDERFARYYRKFPASPTEPIDASCWTCAGYYAQPDTLAHDTISEDPSVIARHTTVFTSETIEDAPQPSEEEGQQ